jgi:hypothetical protein
VEFKDVFTGQRLYLTNLILSPDSEKKLVYIPSANFLIEGLPGAKIKRSDGTEIGIFTNGFLRTELNSFTTDSLTIETRNMKYLLEMDTRVNSEVRLKAVKVTDPRKIDYVTSIPLLNLLIPGFAQFQANDVFLGYFFGGLATAGIGLTAFGFFADSQMTLKANATEVPEDVKKFQTYGELYRTIGYIGVGIWAVSAIVSCVYAYWHPSRYIDPLLPETPLAVGIVPGGFDLQFRIRI